MRRIAIVIAAGLALAGCQQSEQDRVRDAVTAYLHAYADGDAKAVCALLAPELREAFKEGCEARIKKQSDALSEREREALHAQKVGSVSVAGDTARVRIEGSKSVGTLRKVDGRWLIENR
jgi:ketosteroid isomerase-like protein